MTIGQKGGKRAEGASVQADDLGFPRAPAGNGEPSVGETEEIVGLFMAVMGRMRQHFAERSAEFDLSPPQAMALRELAEPKSMGELADRLFCDASNVTGIVDRLESRGLVERQVVPGDRRVKRLVLTAAGRDLWSDHRNRVFDGAPVISSLSPAQRRDFRALLRRMIAHPSEPEAT